MQKKAFMTLALALLAIIFPLACHAATDEQKKYAFDAIERNAEQIAMWTHDADVSVRPVIKYIRENFRPVAKGRGNVLMVRR